jgi:hypothetical protein
MRRDEGLQFREAAFRSPQAPVEVTAFIVLAMPKIFITRFKL